MKYLIKKCATKWETCKIWDNQMWNKESVKWNKVAESGKKQKKLKEQTI